MAPNQDLSVGFHPISSTFTTLAGKIGAITGKGALVLLEMETMDP